MLAIYDLAVSPPTYDFIAFLVAAERARRQTDDEHIDIRIVWGPAHGFRQDDLPPRDPLERLSMLENIVIPMCDFLPSVRSVQTVNREDLKLEGVVFPQNYRIDRPVPCYGLSVLASCANDNVFPLRCPAEKDEALVTITLREAGYWPSRNSDLAEWLKVAEVLKGRGKRVVFVRDTAKADEPIEGFEIDPLASRDLKARMALYAKASLNLMINSGPAGMASFCPDIPMMIFKIFADDAPCTNEIYYAKSGFPKGSQFYRDNHKIVYESDHSEIILREIDAGFPNLKRMAYTGKGNVTHSTVIENMTANCQLPYPWFVPRGQKTGTAVIVGGAPSVLKNLSAIRDRMKRGQEVYAMNNAWRVLPFVPDWIVCMDSRPENAAFFDGAPNTKYLIASSCHPDVFKALEGKDITVWHPHQGIDGQEETVFKYANGRCPAMLGGGGTVGLRSIILCFMSGYRKLHLYGMDSSYDGDKHHAYEQKLNDGEVVIDITPNGINKTYYCAPWMARQADEFQKFYRLLHEQECFIQAHGDGLLPDLCRFINKMNQLKLSA